jgi:Rieske Fe-S protein
MRDADLELEAIGPDGRPLSEQPRWRQDFPIDTAEDNYVSRREFTKFLALTSGAFAVGQIVIAVKSALDSRTLPPGALAIVRADALPVGAAKAFAFPTAHDPCLLVRVDETTYVAYDQRCTHLSCAVVPQPEHDRLFCPCHNGSFDMATGRPVAGPPQRPLPRVTLELRDGTIYATGVEVSTI